jgi:hypothetical protein
MFCGRTCAASHAPKTNPNGTLATALVQLVANLAASLSLFSWYRSFLIKNLGCEPSWDPWGQCSCDRTADCASFHWLGGFSDGSLYNLITRSTNLKGSASYQVARDHLTDRAQSTAQNAIESTSKRISFLFTSELTSAI